MGTVAAFHTDFFLTVRQKAFASSVHTHCGGTDACPFPTQGADMGEAGSLAWALPHQEVGRFLCHPRFSLRGCCLGEDVFP